MKIINTRLHGILDYVVAFLLLLPWMSDFYTGGADTLILAGLGATVILVSLCTNYEFGQIKLIPMKLHLAFDVLGALLLIAMPWIFPVFNYSFYWPVLLGVAVLLVTLLSAATPYKVTQKDINITQP